MFLLFFCGCVKNDESTQIQLYDHKASLYNHIHNTYILYFTGTKYNRKKNLFHLTEKNYKAVNNYYNENNNDSHAC